ncbi:phosphate/phosphite/phosphonate ABC transporter substrate-binding protein [Natronobiforma cellulositropha]|uniref:phosphate/phosphite/phosphonate ABC transporter substrate-binding protein n=1 Tax=Natronobiforma cellulositropha TaxID=1679076 RepID=UPI0021D60EE3|nr:phosphate/phosphite/phosphonate ABC transporter substrate-binding protein [Natronobiforma cellulositropha]
MNRRTYVAAVAGAVMVGAGCLADDTGDDAVVGSEDVTVAEWSGGDLEFGLPPFQDAEELEREYAGLFAWLEDGFEGVEVTGVPTTDYSSVIESVANGHTELANLSPLIYVMAADEGIHPLAVNELHGKSSYHAYIATRADTGIDSLADLEGTRIAMVDPLSTSGGLFPLYMLEEAGFDTGGVDGEPTDLEIEWTLSGHGAALAALEEGHVDAAAYGDFQHPDGDEIVTVAESEPIPLAAAVATPDTPESVRAALTERLYETPEESLEEHMVTGFSEYDPADYEIVREIADEFGLSVSDLDAEE